MPMVGEEREAWLKARRSGIGGSDVSSLFNVPKYGCRRKLYYDKKNFPKDYEKNGPMERGNVMEPVTAVLYKEKTKRELKEVSRQVHKDFPFMAVTMDRIIISSSDLWNNGFQGDGYLEIKNPGTFMMRKIMKEGFPDEYIMQLQWGMFVSDLKWGSLCALDYETWNIFHVDVHENKELQAQIKEEAIRFWREHIINDKIPDRLDINSPQCFLDLEKGQGCQFFTTCRNILEIHT